MYHNKDLVHSDDLRDFDFFDKNASYLEHHLEFIKNLTEQSLLGC